MLDNKVNDEALKDVAGGSEGEAVQIRIGTDGGSWYYCPRCKNLTFYIIKHGPGYVQARCKNCNQIVQVPQ